MSYLTPLGKDLRQLGHGRLDRRRRLQGVGPGPLEDAHGYGHSLVEIAVAVVVRGPELHATDVADADHAPVRSGLHDDIGEGGRVGETALRFDIELEGARLGHRRLVDHAGGHLHVLAAQRRDHVACGQVAGGELFRIEPDAHRVVARAEDGDIADAVDAGQHVLHVQGGVVGDVEQVARIVGRARGGSPSSGRATASSR